MYQGLGQMLTKRLPHHQGCSETPKCAYVIYGQPLIYSNNISDGCASRYDRDVATMVRVIREFLKIPETTFTTQEILDVCGVLNVNAHEVQTT